MNRSGINITSLGCLRPRNPPLDLQQGHALTRTTQISIFLLLLRHFFAETGSGTFSESLNDTQGSVVSLHHSSILPVSRSPVCCNLSILAHIPGHVPVPENGRNQSRWRWRKLKYNWALWSITITAESLWELTSQRDVSGFSHSEEAGVVIWEASRSREGSPYASFLLLLSSCCSYQNNHFTQYLIF